MNRTLQEKFHVLEWMDSLFSVDVIFFYSFFFQQTTEYVSFAPTQLLFNLMCNYE